MRAGGVSLGMIVRLARSGDIARIAKTTGHDFIFIDGQHALFSVETIGHIAQTALAHRRRAAGAGAKLRRPVDLRSSSTTARPASSSPT